MNKNNSKTAARVLLGAGLIYAGVSHLTFARREFRAQVPDYVPLSKDDTVVYSGIAEIALGTALVIAPQKYRRAVGRIAGLFFTAVFPGNTAQYTKRRNAFGLDTDKKRLIRLLFQPALVAWALESTSPVKPTNKLP
ncbi:Uncharacterized membrane protein [Dyadobacter soli]|uniref:Uncharacterized membrane protein n=1 Tax=Dyadobacter soli TaxID=659014 RepID=A0A1G7MMV1_9BACT|nr:hypothetical protein [Dyadobacter soli]SDF62984.1 Uncharacterized membrane protein [Dyadobacter soli]